MARSSALMAPAGNLDDRIDILLRGTGEVFIMKDEISETVKESLWTIVLTDKALYKMLPTGEVRRRMDLLEIHSIDVDRTDSNAFWMFSYKSSTALQADKVKGALGFGMSFESFLQSRRFYCESKSARFQWVIVVNRLLINAWQRKFEAAIIPQPEIYQHHAFVLKINKKGVTQDRTLVISTEWMYNIEISHDPTRIKELKWCLPIMALTSVSLGREFNLPGATFFFDPVEIDRHMNNMHMGSKGKSLHSDVDFLFKDVRQRQHFVREIQRLIYRVNGSHLYVQAEEAPEQEVQVLDPKLIDLRGSFKKLTTSFWQSSVSRYCTFNYSGYIEWADSEETKTDCYRELVTGVVPGGDPAIYGKVDADERTRLFSLTTTGKDLHFVAPSAAMCQRWVDGIKLVLEARSKSK